MINTSPEEVFGIFIKEARKNGAPYKGGSINIIDTLEEFDKIGDALINEYLPKLISSKETNDYRINPNWWFNGGDQKTTHRDMLFSRSNAAILNRLFEKSNSYYTWCIQSENRVECVSRSILFSTIKRFLLAKEINSGLARELLGSSKPVSRFASATYYPDTKTVSYYEAEQFFDTTRFGNIYLKKKVHLKVTVNFSRSWTRITANGKTRYLSLKNWGDYTSFFREDKTLIYKLLTFGDPNLEYIANLPIENLFIPNSVLRKSTNLKSLVKNHLGVSCDYLLKRFSLSEVTNLYPFTKGDKSVMDGITNRIRAISDDDFEVLTKIHDLSCGSAVLKPIFVMLLHGCEFFKSISDLTTKKNEGKDKSEWIYPYDTIHNDQITIIKDLIYMWPNGDGGIFPVKARSYRRLKELHDKVSFYITLNKTTDFKVSKGFKNVFKDNTIFTYLPVDNRDKLVREGLEMKHCVATRRDNIASGKSSVYTILTPEYDPTTQANRYTAEIGVVKNSEGNKGFYIKEIRGIRNCNPPHDVIEQVKSDLLGGATTSKCSPSILVVEEEIAPMPF
jgi:hypothetical protein